MAAQHFMAATLPVLHLSSVRCAGRDLVTCLEYLVTFGDCAISGHWLILIVCERCRNFVIGLQQKSNAIKK
jgi:hypothetical protein